MHLLFNVNSHYDSKFDCSKYRCPLNAMQAYGAEEVGLDALLTSHQIELSG